MKSEISWSGGGWDFALDQDANNSIELPGVILSLAEYDQSIYALVRFERPWWAVWRKSGEHWVNITDKLPPYPQATP